MPTDALGSLGGDDVGTMEVHTDHRKGIMDSDVARATLREMISRTASIQNISDPVTGRKRATIDNSSAWQISEDAQALRSLIRDLAQTIHVEY